MDVRTIQYDSHEIVNCIGQSDILNNNKFAFFCSVKSPGDIILKTFDYAKELREQNVTVISGFHSPMEQECLRILLKGTQPIIICPARSIENMRIPADWKTHIENGRLLILSRTYDLAVNSHCALTRRKKTGKSRKPFKGNDLYHAEQCKFFLKVHCTYCSYCTPLHPIAVIA